MAEPTAPGDQAEPQASKSEKEERLESWGEIASYLGRDVRTVQRWEHDLGLPVHRLKTMKQGQVYAYGCELERWRRERAAKPERAETNSQPGEGGSAETVVERLSSANGKEGSRRRGWKWTVGAIGFVSLAGLIWTIVTVPGKSNFRKGGSEKSQLFVRPFDSLSSAAEEATFVSGLTNELITQFGKAEPERLVVFAPTTSSEYGKKVIPELKQALKADYVLEGSVRRAEEKLRIDVTLVSTEDQKAVWTNSYTTDMKDVLKSQDEVVGDVVGQIRKYMAGVDGEAKKADWFGRSASGGERRGSVDPAAYEVYIKGRLYWLDRDILRSRAAYEEALQRSAEFAPARAGLAMTLLVSGQSPNDLVKAKDSVPQARELAQKALASDPTLGDAYCVLANIAQFYEYDSKEAGRLYEQAVKVDPSNVTAHAWYGYYYMVHNQMTEAERELNKALQLDPAAPLLNTQAAEIKYYRRDYDAALKKTEEILREYPNFVYARIWRGSALREKKEYARALKEFTLLRQQTNNSAASIGLQAHLLGLLGDRKGAMANLRELKNLETKHYVPSIYMAGVYVGLKDVPKAMQKLRLAYEERYDRLSYLNVDPMADPLKGDAGFQELMSAVGVK